MATAAPQVSGLQDLFECPVCLDAFEDPRILVCGHNFCGACLEGIVSQQLFIKCPICRRRTKLGPGKQVADLPRPVLVNELQRKVASLLEGAGKKTTRYCAPCGRKQVTAIVHCYQCKKNYCSSCQDRHAKGSMFESHTTAQIAHCVWCDSHPGDVITAYCEDCKQGICVDCIMGDHSDHAVDDISLLVEESRSHLEELVIRGGLSRDKSEVRKVKTQVSEAENLRQEIHDSVSQLKALHKMFGNQIAMIETNMDSKLRTEIKKMKLYASDLNNEVSSDARLIDYAREVLGSPTDTELVLKERQITASIEGATAMTAYTTTLPDCQATFGALVSGLQDLVDNCDVKYKSFCLGEQALKPPFVGSDITQVLSLAKFQSFTLDSKTQTVVVRTKDIYSPIKVYGYDGSLCAEVTKPVGWLTGRFWRSGYPFMVDEQDIGIAVDNKRSLYLCPVPNYLVLMNGKGEITARIRVGPLPCGISFSEDQDVYAISDIGTHRIYVINASTHQIGTVFGGLGSGNGEFNRPNNLLIGHVTGIRQPVIVISDGRNHRIQVHNLRGGFIKTFGKFGSLDGELYIPWGVTTDPAGRIIVCDTMNSRLVSFWSENNVDHWRCLMHGKKPSSKFGQNTSVSLDHVSRCLAIGLYDRRIILFK